MLTVGRCGRGAGAAGQRQARRRGHRASGGGSPRRSCRRGAASPRRSPRCCRCCTCTACPASDFVPALERFLGTGAGLSARDDHPADRAVAGRGTRASPTGICPVWTTSTCGPTAIHVNVRLDEEKLCLLVMIGVRADGRKELIALADGYRESTGSWADLLRDCQRRGMRAPVLAVGRRRARVLGRAARGVPADPGAAMLVPQDRQRARGAAEVGPSGGEEGPGRDLERRGQRPRPPRRRRRSSWPTAPSSPRPSRRSPTTSTSCSRSTTTRPSTGSTCAPRTRSSRPSPPSGTAPR